MPAGTYRVVCTGFNSGTNVDYGSVIVNGRKLPMPVLGNKADEFAAIKNDVNAAAKVRGLYDDAYTVQGFDILAAGKLLDDNKDLFTVDYYVTITEEDVTNGKNYISLGFSNNNTDDVDAVNYPVFADNFQLFYCNLNYVTYLSANNTNEESIDKFAYERPTDLYLRRSFTPGWNSIVLPFDITVGSLSEFGDGVKLSVLEGINPNRPSQIKFVNTSVLKAGECGLIWVPKDAKPNFGSTSETKDLQVLTAPLNDKDAKVETKKIHGPLYLIKGVKRTGNVNSEGKLEFENVVTKPYETAAGTLQFTGYYYKPKNGTDNVKWDANSYIMENGGMYHLATDWGTIYGTTWCLKDVEGGNKVLEINGVVDEVTAIDGVIFGNNTVKITDKVYNINGQCVGTNANIDRLPKGLYIVNGKKVVVK